MTTDKYKYLFSLPKIQSFLNNFSLSLTKKSLNKIVCNFTLKYSLNMFISIILSEYFVIKPTVSNAIAFIIVSKKHDYDRNH